MRRAHAPILEVPLQHFQVSVRQRDIVVLVVEECWHVKEPRLLGRERAHLPVGHYPREEDRLCLVNWVAAHPRDERAQAELRRQVVDVDETTPTPAAAIPPKEAGLAQADAAHALAAVTAAVEAHLHQRRRSRWRGPHFFRGAFRLWPARGGSPQQAFHRDVFVLRLRGCRPWLHGPCSRRWIRRRLEPRREQLLLVEFLLSCVAIGGQRQKPGFAWLAWWAARAQ
eukprot:scaffold15780_cov68-Phaeocystis_antarctica.AAC.9